MNRNLSDPAFIQIGMHIVCINSETCKKITHLLLHGQLAPEGSS